MSDNLLSRLETVLFGGVHELSDDDKMEAAKMIRADANRYPLVVMDWASERERREELERAVRDWAEKIESLPKGLAYKTAQREVLAILDRGKTDE